MSIFLRITLLLLHLILILSACRGPLPAWRHAELEAVNDLYAIDLAVQRYYESHRYYPAFLIGGVPGLMAPAFQANKAEEDIESVASRSEVCDPLIEERLLPAGHVIPGYPALAVYRKSEDELANSDKIISGWLPTRKLFQVLQTQYDDTYTESASYSRFISLHSGDYEAIRMGNLTADYRYEIGKWGYPFWKREAGSKNPLTLATQFNFYYKSFKSPDAEKPDGYILMVFGYYRSQGLDAFTTVEGGHELDGRLPDGTGIGMGVPVVPELNLNGDGKRDGVILVLHGGWPWNNGR